MPEVVDWQAVADRVAVLRRVVERLENGAVRLPIDGGSSVCVRQQNEAIAKRLLQAGAVFDLAIPSDFWRSGAFPKLGTAGTRLGRRSWPGPVILAPQPASDSAPRIRGYRCPAHELVYTLTRFMPEGLLVTSADLDYAVEIQVDDNAVANVQPTLVEVHESSWRVVEAGAVSEAELYRRAARWVVFVCTGNTCRSPLAEALCKRLLAEKLGCSAEQLVDRGYWIASAGLAAFPGGPATPEAEDVARAHDADLSQHVSQPLDEELAQNADWLVTMTEGHRQSVLAFYPKLGVAPRLLDPAGSDVADPIGHPMAVYEACGAQIRRYVELLVAELVRQ